jgi:3-deoxy-D-manno-octulosonic-acid transferase
MYFLYTTGIRVYVLIIRLASLFQLKARLWVKGRKNIFERIDLVLKEAKIDPTKQKIAWFHCASLGEFEQGRPVIEAYRQHFPEHKIFLTFFSPSGYEVRKTYTGADFIFYLPADTRRQARKFLSLVKPCIAIFVKYEFWFNYLNELKKSGVPTFVISAIFRPTQHFFKWYGEWQRTALGKLDHIFVQNESSRELISFIGINNVTVSGDTRFDRVIAIASQARSFPLVETFAQGVPILVAGSTWPPDENLIFLVMARSEIRFKLIIAPHETHRKRIDAIISRSGINAIRYSEATESNVAAANVLVIDSIGMLSSLYRYATIAYIGGGFGVGIHNTLEAATFGKPVIFGPNFHKFQEARELLDLGAAFSIDIEEELNLAIQKLLGDRSLCISASQQAAEYVRERAGASGIIMKKISEVLNKVVFS